MKREAGHYTVAQRTNEHSGILVERATCLMQCPVNLFLLCTAFLNFNVWTRHEVHIEHKHTFSLFTWRVSLWPNCGFWLIVAFIFWVTFKSVAFLSVTQQIKATIRPQWNAPRKQANCLHWCLQIILSVEPLAKSQTTHRTQNELNFSYNTNYWYEIYLTAT